ncbi:hypothetical protein cyc_00453 [Cyclospora cayetanensis]|uniref:Helicase ATP-binding domain-containing protein n=1 Tax=Cyclospora cayetanensis TaxID=88456 RepID=A0A1D3D4U2_9EIME|nr:hypothetical protein cyc_00453 [Cyclospora cayetanensis]
MEDAHCHHHYHNFDPPPEHLTAEESQAALWEFPPRGLRCEAAAGAITWEGAGVSRGCYPWELWSSDTRKESGFQKCYRDAHACSSRPHSSSRNTQSNGCGAIKAPNAVQQAAAAMLWHARTYSLTAQHEASASEAWSVAAAAEPVAAPAAAGGQAWIAFAASEKQAAGQPRVCSEDYDPKRIIDAFPDPHSTQQPSYLLQVQQKSLPQERHPQSRSESEQPQAGKGRMSILEQDQVPSLQRPSSMRPLQLQQQARQQYPQAVPPSCLLLHTEVERKRRANEAKSWQAADASPQIPKCQHQRRDQQQDAVVALLQQEEQYGSHQDHSLQQQQQQGSPQLERFPPGSAQRGTAHAGWQRELISLQLNSQQSSLLQRQLRPPLQPQSPQALQAVGATTAAEDARGGLNLDVFVPIRQLIEAMRETREVTCLLPWQRDCLLVSRSPTGGNGASSCLGEDAAQSSAASEAAESGASERGDASSAASAAAVAAGIALRWGAKAALAAESQRILDGSLNLVYSAPTGAGKTLVSEVLMLRHIFGLLRLPPRDTQQKELEYQEQPRQLSWPTAPRATPAATAEEVGKSLLSSPQVSDGSAGDAVPPRRVIVVLPFVSLIEEQQQKLQRLFAAASLPIKVIALHHCSKGTPAIDTAADDPAAFDIAFCTIEKAGALLQHLAEKALLLKRVGLVVVDELHALGDPTRGALIECLLSRIVYSNIKLRLHQQQLKQGLLEPKQEQLTHLLPIQVVGMSATLSNLSEVASWLSAAVYSSEQRPLPLQEAYCCSYAPAIKAAVRAKAHGKAAREPTASKSKAQVRLFVKSAAAPANINTEQPWQEVTLPSPLTPLLPHLLHRQGEKQQEWQNPHYKVQAELSRPKAAAEAVALLVADYVMPLLQQRIRMPQHPKEQHGFLSAAAADLRMRRINNVAVLQGGTIKSTVAFAAASGVSIHHAALTVEEKRLAVSFFKEGLVKVLTATSTLAAGVNFPCE